MNVFLDISAAILALFCGIMFAVRTNEVVKSQSWLKILKTVTPIAFAIALLCGFIAAGMDSKIFAPNSHINDWLAVAFVTAASCLILAAIGYICTTPRKIWREFTTCEPELLRAIKLCLAVNFIIFLVIFAGIAIWQIMHGVCVILSVMLSALAVTILGFIVTPALLACTCLIVCITCLIKHYREH